MTRNRRTEVAIGTAAALAAGTAVTSPVQAADLKVTNLSDGAVGSLNAAIDQANAPPGRSGFSSGRV